MSPSRRLLWRRIVVALIDEVNTARQVRGLIKEIMCDHTLDGQPLPANIVWVGAINPPHDGASADAQYIVWPLPPSLDRLQLDFDSMRAEQERSLVDSRLRGVELLARNPQHHQRVLDAILQAHNFVRNCRITRVHVSIRDIVRTIELLRFFLQHPMVIAGEFADREAFDVTLTRALVMALAVSYVFRLDERRRFELDDALTDSLGLHARKFGPTVSDALLRFRDHIVLPKGTAPTRPLLEHVFVCMVCMQLSIPVIVVGPPGCSKSLGFQIAVDNMQGARQLDSALAVRNRQNYQCSEESTAAEIAALFVNAEDLQERAQRDEFYTVFLDEGSLPVEREHALKATHLPLDRRRVGCVIMSNHRLDAAKTNRGIEVYRSRVPPTN